ncbi:MAG: chemotaxis protein CheW [Acetatifactor sp.]|nr:chemotaxis protein CheW [Acetatifactor sp.]
MNEQEIKKRTKYVTFKSGDEYFAVDIQYVNEIIVYQEITKVPESEDYIKGLINLRGKIIPVIDVRIRFKQEPFEYTDRTCIIVVKVKQTVVGLIVEKIAEVVEISEDDIIPSPSLPKLETPQNRYVEAVGKVGDDVKLILNPDTLLKDDEILALEREKEEEEDAEEKAPEVKAPEPVKVEKKPEEPPKHETNKSDEPKDASEKKDEKQDKPVSSASELFINPDAIKNNGEEGKEATPEPKSSDEKNNTRGDDKNKQKKKN